MSIDSEEKKKKDSTWDMPSLRGQGEKEGQQKKGRKSSQKEVGEKPKERMGEGKFKTVSIGDSFKGICCKVEQRNGAVAGSGIEVMSKLCFAFFKDERITASLYIDGKGPVERETSIEGNFSPSASKAGFISLFSSFLSLVSLVP